MGNLRKYLALQAQAKTGLSSGLFVWGLVALVCGILTAGFILLLAFIWLAERYGPLIAAAILAGAFLLVTIVAIVCSLQSRRRTIERAELALAARKPAVWLDPKLVAGAVQAGRAVGWRRFVPLLALGILAATVGMEWSGRRKRQSGSDEQDGRREFARAA
jgi:hypothetical protein